MDYKKFAHILQTTAITSAPPERVWDKIESIGGRHGWYYLDWIWQLRGNFDRAIGGVGMRNDGPERRRPLVVGDIFDFYRIVEVVPQRKLTLEVELKLPGEGVLEFCQTPLAMDRTRVDTAVYFEPAGIAGEAYWIALLPFHKLIMNGLPRAICRRANKAKSKQGPGQRPDQR